MTNNEQVVLPLRDDGPLDLSQLHHAISSTGFEFAFFVLPPRLWCASPEEIDRPVTAPPPSKPPDHRHVEHQGISRRTRRHTI